MLGYVLVAVCASVVGGITETELKRVMEPTVVIASHVYRGGWGIGKVWRE